MTESLMFACDEQTDAETATELTCISIIDLPIAADIGVNDHEIGRPQQLLISVILDVRPIETDRIGATLDYTCIAALAEKLGQQRIALIETFARCLAEECLVHPLVLRADIQVRKPGALTAGLAGARTILRKVG